MNDSELYVIHTDGGSRGNPGPAAFAYVIEHGSDDPIEVRTYMGKTTNNIAEYTGLVKALEHAHELGARKLLVHSDSELMVKQLNGEYKVKNEGLRPLYNQAVRLQREFDDVTFRHIRRELNKHADRLCNEAMDNPHLAEPRIADRPAPRPDQRPAPAKPDPRAELRRRAIAYLEECAADWADADPQAPHVAQVWDRIWRMLQDAHVLRDEPPASRAP